jgi:hypothetical protein
MQGQNVGSIYGSFELDNRGFKSELKKTERETDKLISALNKSGKVKVDTAQWKKLTAEMGALNKRAHDTQMALLKAPAGTPEAKKLSGELKNLEARIRMIKKVTDPTTKAIKDMAKANQVAAGSSKAVGAGGGQSGIQQFGGAFAQQATSRMGAIGGIMTTASSAGPYVAAAALAVGAIAGVGVAAKKTADSIKSMAAETAAWSEAVMDMSTNTGISTEMLQKLQHVSAMSGLSYEGITRGIAILIRRMPEAVAGTGDVARALQKLGVSATTSSGQLRSMDDLVPEIIAKLQRMQNTTERNATAAALFGRGWMELGPILGMTADDFAGVMNQATALGLVLSNQELANVQAYDDTLDELNQTLAGVKKQIGAAFAPYLKTAIEPLVEALPRAVEKLKTWLDSIKPTLAALAESFKSAWAAIAPALSAGVKNYLAGIADGLKVVAWVVSKIASAMPGIVEFLTRCFRVSFWWYGVVRNIYAYLARILRLPPVEMPDWGEPPEINAIDVEGIEDASDAVSKQEQLASDAQSEVEGLRRQIALAGDSSAAAAMQWEILNGKYREASDATKKLLMDTAKMKDASDAHIESNKKHAASISATVDAAKSAFNVVKQRASEAVRLMEQFANATINEVKRQADEEKRIRDEAASDAKTHYEKLSELGRAGALAKTGVSMFGGKTTEIPISYSADKVSAAAAAVKAGQAAEAKVRAAVEGQLFGGAIARQRAIAGAAEPPWDEIKTYLTGSTSLFGQLVEFASVLPLLMLEVRRATRPAVESGI